VSAKAEVSVAVLTSPRAAVLASQWGEVFVPPWAEASIAARAATLAEILAVMGASARASCLGFAVT